MYLTYFVIITISQLVTAPLAPTWDSCQCRWDPWKAWSTCSKTCGGGIQTRERSVWGLDVPACEGFKTCASEDMGMETKSCNTICVNGGSYRTTWSVFGRCDCPKGRKGSCCEQIVDCGPPSTLSHGSILGSGHTYNNQIQYKCDENYNMTDPAYATRTCTEYGYWSGRSPHCLNATSCNSSPCENNATCGNLLNDYTCQCLPGWTGKNCETDIQPPVISHCPDNRTIYTTNMTSVQTWTEPAITDPFGNDVESTKNYQHSVFTFPWGEFVIQYSGVKLSNGLRTDCVFTIGVKPHPCPRLTVPKHGYIICNNWNTDYASVCKALCNVDFTYPPRFTAGDWFNCGASGNWLPTVPLLDCVPDSLVVKGAPIDTAPKMSNCSDDSQRSQVASYYIQELKLSAFNELCENNPKECNIANIRITC